ncbi:Uncharacterised protein [Vibrio cholerae]|nr:Uncharacterised protein [Vibrio cholerae]
MLGRLYRFFAVGDIEFLIQITKALAIHVA